MGTSKVKSIAEGDHTYMTYRYGMVPDYITGKPVGGPELDVWQAASNGLYC